MSGARRGSVVVVVVWAVAIAAVLVAATQVVSFRQAVVGRETLARVQARWAARAGVEQMRGEAVAQLVRMHPVHARDPGVLAHDLPHRHALHGAPAE